MSATLFSKPGRRPLRHDLIEEIVNFFHSIKLIDAQSRGIWLGSSVDRLKYVGRTKAEFARTLVDGQAGFSALLDAVEAHLERSEVPPVASAQLMIALDEVISNVLKHSSGSQTPTIKVALDIAEDAQGGSVTAEVVDDGQPFDPLSMPEPDISLSVEDRQIGGLGIHLVRKLMNEVAYVREEGQNRLRFSKIYTLD